MPNLAKLVAVSSLAGNLELVGPALHLYKVETLRPPALQCSYILKLAVLSKVYVHAVQRDVYWICAAVIEMVSEAKNELKQYLSSFNPIYAKYTECLWAKEVNSAAQLGNASVPVMHAFGIETPVHAGDIIAQSKAKGKWSYCYCSITPVHCPASKRSCAAASCCRALLDPKTCLGDGCLPECCQHTLKTVH